MSRASSAVRLSSLLAAALLVRSQTVQAGPFQDGVLFLHVNDTVVYSTGEDPRGASGGVLCEEAVTSTPIGDEITVCFVVAAFPPRVAPTLRTLSFGIDYDATLLEIVETRWDAFPIDRSSDWPQPRTSAHLQLNSPVAGRSHEILWLAVRQLTDQPAELRLEAGAFGGRFGDNDAIASFGTFGFGQPGTLECVPLSTCCLPDRSCEFLTVSRCLQLDGFPYEDTQDCAPCQELGACCVGWECSLDLAESCAASGGEFAGEGTACEPNDCIPYGACCQRDGSCIVQQQDQCPDYAFVIGAACDPGPCAELGACCYQDETNACIITTQERCDGNGSVFQGAGTACEPEPCLAGLCCIEFPNCVYTTRNICDSKGRGYVEGYYGPADSACPLACFGYPPVLETSWGQVKSRFRGSSEK